MRFQPVKCNMMQLTDKHSNKIQASYTLEGTVLENVDNIKYLGVTITNDLKWNTHISNICNKAFRRVYREPSFMDVLKFFTVRLCPWDMHLTGRRRRRRSQ